MAYSQSQLRCLAGMGIVPWVLRDELVQSDLARTEVAQTDLAQTEVAQTEVEVLTSRVVASEQAIGAVAAELSTTTATKLQTAPEQAAKTSASPTDLLRTPLVAIPFRGRRCTQLGNPDASLLILVEAISTQQNQYPFEAVDAKIFEDMLRAIAWRRQDVCLAVVPPATQSSLLTDDQGACVADLCRSPRDVVLLFRQQLPNTLNPDELRVSLSSDTGNQTGADLAVASEIPQSGALAWQLPHPALLRESPQRKRQAWEVLKAARARLG